MTEDIIKSIKATLYDRAASPLFGTVTISWMIWNYRLFLVLFSSMPIPDKFSYIDEKLYGGDWSNLLGILCIYPLLTAAFFLFIYPYPAKWVFEFWRNRQKDLKEIKQKIEDETLLTIEESRIVRLKIIDIKADYERQILQSNEEMEVLKNSLDKYRESAHDEYQQAINNRDDEIKSLSKALDTAMKNENRITESYENNRVLHDEELESILLKGRFRLFHNPRVGPERSKVMMFSKNGRIEKGKNNNEFSWRISNGYLELLQADKEVHSRFIYNPESRIFTHTNDEDTPSARGQYIIPEVESTHDEDVL